MKNIFKIISIIAALFIVSIPSFSQNTTGNWTITGPIAFPTNISGQIHGIGRVSQIKFHASNSLKVYAVSASGGLWISTDGGANWNKTGTDKNFPLTSCASVCVDYSNDNIIYLSTGDANYYSDKFGIYKSTDGGATWSPSHNSIGNRMALEILMSQTNHNILIAATTDGIWRSLNAGATWTVKKAGGAFKDMVFQPGSSSVMFAADDNSFWRSTDTGNNWVQIASVNPAAGNGGRIAVSAANANTVYVGFVGSNTTTGNGGIIYRSTDGGLNFTLRKGDVQPNLNGYSGTEDGQGNYNWTIFADRVNANIVYACGHVVWKSTDGGANWTQLTNWWEKCHTDMHHIVTSPYNNAKLFNANDGGIFASADAGVTWLPSANGLSATEVYHMGQSNLARGIAGIGTQDNGELYFNTNTWYTNRGGDWGSKETFDYANADKVYYRENASRRDLVANGSETSIGLAGPANDDVYATSSLNTGLMFAGQSNVLRRSANLQAAAPTWKTLKTFTPSSNRVMAVAVSPASASELYAVTWNNQVWFSNNATATTPTFTSYATPATVGNHTFITVNKSNPSIVYMALEDKMYRSVNKGQAWTDISAGLVAGANIVSLLHDPYSTNESMYLATTLGVYYRNNTMNNWQSFSTGLPVIAEITDMFGYFDGTSNSVLRVSYYGRGVWESPLYSTAAGFNPNTYYKITNKYSSKALDIEGASLNDGSFVIQKTYSGTTSQKWKLVSTGNGNYKIVNRNSNKNIDNPGSSAADGTEMIQYQDNGGGSNQQWQITDIGAGNYKIINASSGKALDNPASSTADGTHIIQWAYSGGSNQQWQITDVGSAFAAVSSIPLSNNLVNELSDEVMLAPNPAKSNTQIIINTSRDILALMQVVNAAGEVVLYRRQQLTAGANKISINTASLATGEYYVIVRMNEKTITKKLIIQQ